MIEYGLNSASNFRLFNFATGSYTCKCVYCGCDFIGDKRACQCLECAIKQAEKGQENMQRRPELDPQKWCMCTVLGGVARDGRSTCMICGGKDAYGESPERGNEYRKVVVEKGKQ